MPCFVARAAFFRGFHFHENVSRIKHFLDVTPLAASNFDDLFGRNQNVVNFVLEVECLNAAPQTLGNFAVESRIRVNDVPELGHEPTHPPAREVTQNPLQTPIHNKSTSPRYSPKKNTATTTTIVVPTTSCVPGQDTFFISLRTSL